MQDKRPNGEQVLVLATERVHGFIVFAVVLGEGSIYNLAVHPAHQRQGVGSVLLASALRRMRAQEAHRCLLELRQSNTSALSLYTSAGFTLDGVRRHYYRTDEGRENALLMSRFL